MDQARRELGEDALLINARPATPEVRYLGAYEVVFGIAPPVEAALSQAEPSAPDLKLREDLAEMRRQIERLMLTFPATPDQRLPPSAPAGSVVTSAGKEALLAEEVAPELADAVCAGRRLTELFTTDSTLGRPGALGSTVALVGPPGAGKTATLIKLAVRYGLACRRSVQILSADLLRIGAADQVRTMAAILGIACDLAETPLSLSQKLDEPRASNGLTLIDTPGFSFREMEDASELVEVLASREDVDVHLVLPASMKMSDLSRVVDSYGCFRPSKLIFTRLDETAHYGSIVNLSAATTLPVSFLCSGQLIPDDLEEVTTRRIEELILGDNPLCLGTLRSMGASA